MLPSFAAFLTPFLSSAVNLALPAIGKRSSCKCYRSWLGYKQFYSVIGHFLMPFGRLGRHCRKKKDLFPWNPVFYYFNFSDNLFSQYSFTDHLKDIPGISSAMIFGPAWRLLLRFFSREKEARQWVSILLRHIWVYPADLLSADC